MLQDHPGKKFVHIAPLKALVRKRVLDWKTKFEENMDYKVSEVSGDFTPDYSLGVFYYNYDENMQDRLDLYSGSNYYQIANCYKGVLIKEILLLA
ncbi:unnamed protein product [Auanema sp. JU1783]|nr:unnamed protein product [Auanema sp. JU1783]